MEIIIGRQIHEFAASFPLDGIHNFLVVRHFVSTAAAASSFHRHCCCRWLQSVVSCVLRRRGTRPMNKHARGIGKTRLPFTCLLKHESELLYDDKRSTGQQQNLSLVLSDSVLTSLFPCNNSWQFIAVANKFIRSGLHNINRPASSAAGVRPELWRGSRV